jgi:hypothetical protein
MKKDKPERIFKPNKKFKPLLVDEGDEIYPNGIFSFNITKMLAYMKDNPEIFILESINTEDYRKESTAYDEHYIDSVYRTDPVILAEISPGNYNLIDGNHRVEKISRKGGGTIMAYRITPEYHMQFLTSQNAYDTYIEYWNSKVKDLKDMEKL